MPPFDFESLMQNPIAAMGIGLLTSNTPQEGIKQGFGLLNAASERKRQKELDKLREEELRMKMNGGDKPANIREWEIYSAMTPEQQKQYLTMKRAQQIMDLGGTKAVRDPLGGLAENYPVTPKPEDMPAFKGAQSEAAATGTAKGAAQGAIEKKYIQAPQIETYLQQAEKLLPQATSGGMSTNMRDISSYFGHATEGSQIDSQLQPIAAALTAGVPRMEGPQSNLDVELYKQAAGDLANSKLPVETRLSAIKTIRELNNKYMQRQPDAADVFPTEDLAPLPPTKRLKFNPATGRLE